MASMRDMLGTVGTDRWLLDLMDMECRNQQHGRENRQQHTGKEPSSLCNSQSMMVLASHFRVQRYAFLYSSNACLNTF